MDFAARLAALPGVEHLAGLELHGPQGQAEVIENRPGSAGSLRVYAYLLAKYGAIDAVAAGEGLSLYAEHCEDAHRHPGKHLNIERLVAVRDGGGPWRGRAVPKERKKARI